MESRARLSWKSQPRIMLVAFILSRERQEPAELRASEGALGSQGTMGQRGCRGGTGSKERRYVCCLTPRPSLLPTGVLCQGMGTGWAWERCATQCTGSEQLPMLQLCHRQAEVPLWKEGTDDLGSPCWAKCCLAMLSILSSLTFGLAWVIAGGDLLVQAKLPGHLLPSTKIPARGGWGSPWKSELSF